MAEVLHKFEFRQNQRRQSRYDRFLDGQIWKILLSDLDSKTSGGAAAAIRNRAKQRGIGVHISEKDPAFLIVQSYNLPDREKGGQS
jgi:hypothetical protein